MAKAKEKKEVNYEAIESVLREKYPDVMENTLTVAKRTENGLDLFSLKNLTDEDRNDIGRIVSHVGQTKNLVQRTCAETDKAFWLATSDLHQCRYAPEIRKAKAKEATKARKAATKAATKAEADSAQSSDEAVAVQG